MTDHSRGLMVDNLSVRDAAGESLVTSFSLSLPAGSLHVILGESGAGKSLICAAIAGTLSPDLKCSGRVVLDDVELSALSPRERRSTWSRDVFLLPQEPWTALAPARSLVSQVADMPRLHAYESRRTAHASAASLLSSLGLFSKQDHAKKPWQLSGGMAQRACVATALGAPARLILVDEPTKGLDADRRREVAEALKVFVEGGRTVIVVTHDLALASMLGGSASILRAGAVVERGETASILTQPTTSYAKELVDADPMRWQRPAFVAGERVAALSNVNVRAGVNGPLIAERFTLDVCAGEIVGLVGPSGSGKTTIGDILLKLRRHDGGEVTWSTAHRRQYQKIYQNPGAAFADWRTLEATVNDALPSDLPSSVGRDRVDALLRQVGLTSAILSRRPHQVSGGELQRVCLVRCMLCDPLFIFADEPTSRLDALTQKSVMRLIATAVEERRLGVLLVSHDEDLVRQMTRRFARLERLNSDARSTSAAATETQMRSREDA